MIYIMIGMVVAMVNLVAARKELTEIVSELIETYDDDFAGLMEKAGCIAIGLFIGMLLWPVSIVSIAWVALFYRPESDNK